MRARSAPAPARCHAAPSPRVPKKTDLKNDPGKIFELQFGKVVFLTLKNHF